MRVGGLRPAKAHIEIEKVLSTHVDKVLLAVETGRRETSADTKALQTMRASLVAKSPKGPERLPEMQPTELGPATPSRRPGRNHGSRLRPEGLKKEEGGLRWRNLTDAKTPLTGGFPRRSMA